MIINKYIDFVRWRRSSTWFRSQRLMNIRISTRWSSLRKKKGISRTSSRFKNNLIPQQPTEFRIMIFISNSLATLSILLQWRKNSMLFHVFNRLYHLPPKLLKALLTQSLTSRRKKITQAITWLRRITLTKLKTTMNFYQPKLSRMLWRKNKKRKLKKVQL